MVFAAETSKVEFYLAEDGSSVDIAIKPGEDISESERAEAVALAELLLAETRGRA